MDDRRFLIYNLIGGVTWTVTILMLGYGLGQIRGIDKYLLVIVAVIVAVSAAPVAIEVLRSRRSRV